MAPHEALPHGIVAKQCSKTEEKPFFYTAADHT